MSNDPAVLKSALAELLEHAEPFCDPQAQSDLELAAARARDLLAGSRREFFVVISERDIDAKYLERNPEAREMNPDIGGPIVFECYLDKATRVFAEERARNLGDRYGWVRIARLIVEDWPT